MHNRLMRLAVILAALFLAHSALAGKGGKSSIPATIVFDDLAGDAIQSDGLGPYEGSVNDRDGSFVLQTGARTLTVDFGGQSGPREISNVTLTVGSLDGATAVAEIEYTVVDPNGGSVDVALRTIVSVTPSNGAYLLETIADTEYWARDRTKRTNRGVDHTGSKTWQLIFTAPMPWGAAVDGS